MFGPDGSDGIGPPIDPGRKVEPFPARAAETLRRALDVAAVLP